MHTAMLKRMVKRLEARAVRSCPECRDWPDEIALRIIEEIIEPGQPIPPPDPSERRPGEYGPCPCCNRRHKARIIEVVED